MGSKYLDSDFRVRLFGKVTQAIIKDKIKPDTNGNYWGKPQEIHLKKRCTSVPKVMAMPYKAPYPLEPITDSKGCRHYQFHTIVLVKVQLADQCKTSKKKTKMKLIDLYKVKSSQGSTPSPGACCSSKKCNWGGSYREASRGRKASKEADDCDNLKEY